MADEKQQKKQQQPKGEGKPKGEAKGKGGGAAPVETKADGKPARPKANNRASARLRDKFE